jgi:hypothetical protein
VSAFKNLDYTQLPAPCCVERHTCFNRSTHIFLRSDSFIFLFNLLNRFNMEYTNLGNSGLKISKVIYGCMSFGSSKWQDWVLDEEAALPLLKHAYDVCIPSCKFNLIAQYIFVPTPNLFNYPYQYLSTYPDIFTLGRTQYLGHSRRLFPRRIRAHHRQSPQEI